MDVVSLRIGGEGVEAAKRKYRTFQRKIKVKFWRIDGEGTEQRKRRIPSAESEVGVFGI
jgi:hypothetical protein